MFRYLELCVDLKKSHVAKEGLFQYRNMCQSTNVASLASVVQGYLTMAEKRTDSAKQESVESVQVQAKSPCKYAARVICSRLGSISHTLFSPFRRNFFASNSCVFKRRKWIALSQWTLLSIKLKWKRSRAACEVVSSKKCCGNLAN